MKIILLLIIVTNISTLEKEIGFNLKIKNYEYKNNEGKNLIILSTILNKYEILKKILEEKKININEQDSFGKTAIMYASENGNWQTIELLSINGASESIKDITGKTAYDYASNDICRSILIDPTRTRAYENYR